METEETNEERVRDMQQIHGGRKDRESQPVIMRDSERHVATSWDRRESERQPAKMGDSERHAQPPWHWNRQ